MGGASSETKARGEHPKLNLAKCDEREAAAHEAPPHRDGDVTISPREANSWREVSSPMVLHPPFSALTSTCCVAQWQVSCLAPLCAAADSTVKMVTNGLEHRHPAADGPPPPGWRLHLGGAGRRRRRHLHLRSGLPTLHWACASMDRLNLD